MNSIRVSLEERSYEIVVGSGILKEINALCEVLQDRSSTFFVVDEAIESTHAVQAINATNAEVVLSLEATEKHKSMESTQAIWDTMLQAGCDRQSVLFAMGGGIVGDVGGFAAATYMRGIRLVQIPTTLLSMVDASIGGKTGVNAAMIDGEETVLAKNMIGSFWQPSIVIADVDTLQTLDDRQLRCGLAECIKHGLIGHPELLTFIVERIDDIMNRDPQSCVDLVMQSASIKASIVEQDEREAGCRAWLNLGHTFAHVIEPIEELSLYHGEAVAIGLCAAASCAEAMELVESGYVDQVREVITAAGLPTRMHTPIDTQTLIDRMQTDKKTVNQTLRLVLPVGTAVQIIDEVDSSALNLAWASVGASV